MVCEKDEYKCLAADLLTSDLMVGKLIGSRLIRKLIMCQAIQTHRDLFKQISIISKVGGSACFSESDRTRLNALGKLKIDRDRYFKRSSECLNVGIHSISEFDDRYPPSMRKLDGMPMVIYYKGDPELIAETGRSVAVVGTRKPSNYGLRATDDIVRELALRGIVIVSGLARGIDTAAHLSALRTGGKTVAVTACGLDLVYPPENKDLFTEIAENGLLISEMPPGQEANRRYFPARNRIMSALSDAVAIMEAGEFSGTLHTASFAVAQGRDVFVLPGSIYSTYCKGNLYLLKDGAEILISADDIIARLAGTRFYEEMDKIRSDLRKSEVMKLMPDHPEKLKKEEVVKLIIDALNNEDLTADELVTTTEVPFATIAPLLSELVFSGRVIEHRDRFALTFPYT
ncbi:MAG: DNA-protecting protein DprA [Clostridiaceae bacterium]|jgi:DNA processing protein|nr:DNA-protecting protein DprA [Clostridiaceae bacterium]